MAEDGDALAPGIAQDLEARVRAEQAGQKLPSLVAGVARAGRLRWWGSAGTTGTPGGNAPDSGTQYRIGSISKTFAAVCVMRLRDQGRLDLDDAIGAHLPELAALPVTVADLLSHVAGLPAETPAPWWERVGGGDFSDLVARALRPDLLLWRPRRRFHYSNVGYGVLGELVGRLRSQPYWDVVTGELLEPLGMGRTSVRPRPPHAQGLAVHPHADLVHAEPEHDHGAMAPAGQLWSTLEDLARWADVLGGGRPDVLSQETAAEMAEPLAVADVPGQPWVAAYGLGLMVTNHGGRRRFGHAGAMPGHWAMLQVDPSSGDAVVALANSTYRGQRSTFFDELFGALESRPQERPFAPDVSATPEVLELLGAWYWGPVEHRLGLGPGGVLELRGAGPGRDCDFTPLADGSYVGRFGYFNGERLTIARRADGSIDHLDVASFVFTRTPYDASAEVPGGVDDLGWLAGGSGD